MLTTLRQSASQPIFNPEYAALAGTHPWSSPAQTPSPQRVEVKIALTVSSNHRYTLSRPLSCCTTAPSDSMVVVLALNVWSKRLSTIFWRMRNKGSGSSRMSVTAKKVPRKTSIHSNEQ